MEPSNRSFSRRRGYVVFFWGVCLIFWLIPFFITGWSRKRWNWLPRIVNYQHSASALFTTEIKGWRDYHIEWKRQDGKWFEMKEQIPAPFDYRLWSDFSPHDRAPDA